MVTNSAYVTRQQLSICVYYAMKIYECQGISVESAVIDAGNSIEGYRSAG